MSRRRRRGKRSRASIQIELATRTQFSVDLDVRKLLHELRIAVADHYRAALIAGQRADGRGPLPALASGAAGREFGVTRRYGVESGFMAENWLVFGIRGGPFRAAVTLKPNGAGGRGNMINAALRNGVDFQSIEGDVAQIIQRTTQDWMQNAVPSGGDGVSTPPRTRLGGGTLRQVKGA